MSPGAPKGMWQLNLEATEKNRTNPDGGTGNQPGAPIRARCSANAWLLWVSSKSSW